MVTSTNHIHTSLTGFQKLEEDPIVKETPKSCHCSLTCNLFAKEVAPHVHTCTAFFPDLATRFKTRIKSLTNQIIAICHVLS